MSLFLIKGTEKTDFEISDDIKYDKERKGFVLTNVKNSEETSFVDYPLDINDSFLNVNPNDFDLYLFKREL